MLEEFDITIPYAPVSGIRSLCIIIAIAFAEGLILILLDIYNALQNNILYNPTERVYLNLPCICMHWYKRNFPKYPLSSRNQKELCIQSIKPIQVTKPDGKLCRD